MNGTHSGIRACARANAGSERPCGGAKSVSPISEPFTSTDPGAFCPGVVGHRTYSVGHWPGFYPRAHADWAAHSLGGHRTAGGAQRLRLEYFAMRGTRWRIELG